MKLNKWWESRRGERYWLETTDRPDIGVDLKAPQRDEAGKEHHSYSLIEEVDEGDVVLHYQMSSKSVVAWSRARGGIWEEDIVWGSHASAGALRRRQPGWRRGLEGPYWFETPVSQAQLRSHEAEMREVRQELESTVRGAVYFPFELSSKRPPRATQFYLSKVPARVVRLFPEMAAALTEPPVISQNVAQIQDKPAQFGEPYVEVSEDAATSLRDPFFVDPAIVDRGVNGHARTQNALAYTIREMGCEPRQPRPDEPQFDVAWTRAGCVFVAEVKSLTRLNEEQQLRLGLGQVLRYRQVLQPLHAKVKAVIAVEREPTDTRWIELCDDLGVLLVWPGSMATLADR